MQCTALPSNLISMKLATTTPAPIGEHDFYSMLDFSRLMHRLKFTPCYLNALDSIIPEAARIDPGMPSVLMGYDFHLTPDGPRLIEINNNAGGLYISEGEEEGGWLPQPDIPQLLGEITSRIVAMFPADWKSIAIMDEDVQAQYMYPEMVAYAELLRSDGRQLFIVSPEDIQAGDDGLYVEGVRLDGIYNRHTDFYLESEQLLHIRNAYFNGQIRLSPNPRSYALLGDKGRMVDWWHPGLIESCFEPHELQLVHRIVPEIHLLSEVGPEEAWAGRKEWVFKPAARHGGKGVLLGKSISRKRFDELDLPSTVMQQYVAPSTIDIDGNEYKFDVRLYMHGENLIAMAGRAWQGQVTNFRAEGSGWVPLTIA